MAQTVRYEGNEISVETPLGKELLRWERPADYRPENHPFPRMVYKAYKGTDGVIRCMEPEPRPHIFLTQELYRSAIEKAELFTRECQFIVQNEEEYKRARGDGWRDTPKEAEAAAWDWEHAMSQAAAERAYQDRNISEKARAEVAAAEASTPNILPVIPEAPLVKKPHPLSKEARAERAAKSAAA